MFARLFSAVLLTAALALAQRGGGRGNEDDTAAVARRTPRGPNKFAQFADKLRLTPDQRTEARSIIIEAAKQTGPLQQQLMKARENLAGALIAANSQQADQVLSQ